MELSAGILSDLDRNGIRSVETRHHEEREALFQGLHNLDRRSFLRVSTGAVAAAMASGVSHHFHSFLPVNVAYALHRVAGLDNAVQSAFEVGAPQREWLRKDLEKVPPSTPLYDQLVHRASRARQGVGAR
jgi:hypothetical protein